MVRYLLAAAAVVALISGSAFAETGDMGNTTKKVITRTAPNGMAQKKVIIKRHDGRYGELVRHHFDRDRMYGSSMFRHHRMFEPGAGGVVVKKRTVIRDRSY